METPRITWRMGVAARTLAALVMLVGILLEIGFVAALVEERELGFVGALLVLPCFVVWLWCAFLRPSIGLTSTELVLRNKYRTERVELRTIQAVVPSSGGLVIVVDGRPACTGWAVQKSNLALWLNREGRADRIAEQIRQAALAGGAPVAPAPE
ncbi:hypothetical protein [Actinoallomurus liliacearum]